jgi:hypothetical protein
MRGLVLYYFRTAQVLSLPHFRVIYFLAMQRIAYKIPFCVILTKQSGILAERTKVPRWQSAIIHPNWLYNDDNKHKRFFNQNSRTQPHIGAKHDATHLYLLSA